MNRPSDTRKEDETTFEAALERLEKIVEEMESGGLGLEALIARFEEGRRKIAYCSSRLNDVERRIEALVEKNGEITAEPFAAAADDDRSAEDVAAEPVADDDDAPF